LVAKSNSATAKAEQSVEAVWQEVLARLAGSIGAVSHRTWLAPTRLQAIDGATATVEVPHAFAQRWIERHLRDAITTELGAVTGQALTVQFVTPSAAAVDGPAVAPVPAALPVRLVSTPAVEPADHAPAAPLFTRRGGVIRRVRREGTG
jgi:chromosomal replication initiation ATPase DnaA